MVDSGAIIGGCVAGGVVLVVILGFVIYILCGKRKHHKRRDPNKFRHLSPGASPAHSQPSTLGHAVQDGRLPKVNSTGLWIETPSVYSVAPSQAYFYGRPPGKAYRDDRSQQIPRAVSEARIPQASSWSEIHRPPPRPPSIRRSYSSESWAKVPVHPGAQRFYHSQQLAPVYEMPQSPGMEIYDVYQFAGGYSNGAPRSKLLETKHTPSYYHYNHLLNHGPQHNTLNGEFRLGNSRLERSQSDAQDRSLKRGEKRNRRPNSRHSNSPAGQHPMAGSRERLSANTNTPEEARRKRASKSLENLKENGAAVPVILVGEKADNRVARTSSMNVGDKRPQQIASTSSNQRASAGGPQVNAAFSHDTASKKNSDSQKSQPDSGIASASPSSPTGSSGGIPGVVSTYVSGSQGSKKSNNSSKNIKINDAPDVTQSATDSMKLLSKNKTDDQKTHAAPSPPGAASIMVEKKSNLPEKSDNNTESAENDLNFTRYQYGGDIYTMPSRIVGGSDEDYDNPIVSRMKQMVLDKSRSNPTTPRNNVEEPKATSTAREESGKAGGQGTVDLLDGLVLPDILDVDSKSNAKQISSPPAKSTTLGDSIAQDSKQTPLKVDTTDVILANPSSPTVKEPLSPRVSSAETAEEINKAGKRIAADAFEFLEQYLSDDEGTETSHVDSPPLSPSGLPVGVY